MEIFSDMCANIDSGNITAEVLRKVQQNADTFDTISLHTQNSPQSIHSVLQKHEVQLQNFENQKKQLVAVCGMLPDEVQGT